MVVAAGIVVVGGVVVASVVVAVDCSSQPSRILPNIPPSSATYVAPNPFVATSSVGETHLDVPSKLAPSKSIHLVVPVKKYEL